MAPMKLFYLYQETGAENGWKLPDLFHYLQRRNIFLSYNRLRGYKVRFFKDDKQLFSMATDVKEDYERLKKCFGE